jgi:hypothetical protein
MTGLREHLISSGIVSDAKVGIRRLLRSPWLSAIAVLSIAISTAALAATFCVVRATEFRKLPYASSDRLSILYTRHDSASSAPGSDGPGVSYVTFMELRRRVRSLERFEAISVVTKRLDVDGAPGDQITGRAATPGLLAMLSVKPLLGRWIADYDTLPGAERVIVLSHAEWLKTYGGDRSAVGKSVLLRDRFPVSAPANRYTIVGVLPPGFVWDQRGAFWVPLGPSEPQTLTAVSPIGLVRRDLSLRLADEEVRAIGRDLGDVIEQVRPPGDKSLGGKLELRSTPVWNYLHDRVGGGAARFALFALALCVLVLSVANVLSLNLLSARVRRIEFAVRSALGASRGRIARQTVTEAIVLTTPACVLGLLFAPPLIRVASDKLKVAALGVSPSVDGTTLLTITAVALLIAVVLGLTPGLMYSSRDVTDGTAIRGSSSAAWRVTNLHRVLVVVETVMAIVVLTGAGLVVRELNRLAFQELGYSPSGPPTSPRRLVLRGRRRRSLLAAMMQSRRFARSRA